MKSKCYIPVFAGVLIACGPTIRPETAPSPTAAHAGHSGESSADLSSRAGSSNRSRATPTDTVSSAEVSEQVARVFGPEAASEPEPVEGGGVAAGGDEAATWDIDVRSYETHERVAHFVKAFSGPARDRLASRLARGSRFEPMIRAKLRAGNLPEDMYYLALIESGYNPDAYSRAAAVGMWQFMTTTAKGMGLRVDWWVDERRDPVRSTDAAVRFLRGLNEQFGSLYLAAAAYNGGPNRVARGLSRFADDFEGTTGDDLFFALIEKDHLPRETQNYVPQLIAAAIVGKEPRRYGLDFQREPTFAYDSVRVGPATPLPAVAKAAGTTVEEIVDLNPHILRGMTPPRDSISVRVPVGRAAGFDSAFAALSKEELEPYKQVKSKKGETLRTIARRERLSEEQLSWFNPKVRKVRRTSRLVPGQTIIVPTVAVAEAARDVPDPMIERYGSSRRTRTHVVKAGESLGTIARKYKTSVAALKRMNRLRKDVIFPGQQIVVSSSGKARSSSKASTKRKSSTTTRKGSTRKSGTRS